MVLVYCELTENRRVADVSLELCTKGHSLAQQLGTTLEALVCGDDLTGIEEQLYPYGVDTVLAVADNRLFPYRTLPHFSVAAGLIEERKPV